MATKPSVTVRFTQPGTSTVVTLTSNVITGCSWSWGRQYVTDSFQGNTCQVFGIKPGNVTTFPELGAAISVEVTDASGAGQTAFFNGFCFNVEIQYGIIAALDTFTISLESPLSRLGRQTATLTTTAGSSITSAITSLDALTPLGVEYNAFPFYSTTSAQTIEQTITDHINLLQRGEQCYVIELGNETVPEEDSTSVTFISNKTPKTLNSWTISDTGTTTSTTIRYEQINFQSMADNYSTKVIVNAVGFAQQDAGTGTYVYELDTINGSASQADDIAGYVKTMLDLNQRNPTSVRFNGAANNSPIQAARMGTNYDGVTITFRGTTYYALIEGCSFNANASNWDCELYLSALAYQPWFQLDSTQLGVLNTNKLGL